MDGLTSFRVVEADAYQDAEEKIDFIIHIEKHRRGVEVEIDGETYDIAVQFTLAKKARGKMSQINRVRDQLIESGVVDDIVLLQFGIKNLIKYYQGWFEDSMPPGGPFQYSSTDLRKSLFYKVLKLRKIPYFKKIGEFWQEIEPQLVYRGRDV